MTATPRHTEFDLHPDAILLEARKIEASRQVRVFIASHLLTEFGKPFSVKGFQQWFAKKREKLA